MEDGSKSNGTVGRHAKAKPQTLLGKNGPSSRTPKVTEKQKEIVFKASHGLLVAFLIWVFILHTLGIYLFTSGFLLTRLVLDEKSECGMSPTGSSTASHAPSSPDVGCWHPRTFSKAVVIIVDALRYDFTVPFRPSSSSPAKHFHNSIPLFHETATQHPHNALLLPFIADPPTTTLQRLKGLTTGTLPTFIDAGSNFAGTAIEEDNLVAQLRNAGKNIVHLGDDTWHSLFPGYFDPNLTRSYDSFNVWDLHTVDNGVSEHLFPLLHPANASQWDVIIGHYLGVDHAGHRYGPDHPAMATKLQQMDGIFRRVLELLDDHTLLVVMGDHGMDTKGDHGGESDDEVEAVLWMYSTKPVFGRSSPATLEPPATAKERPVQQIDLVPTLSLLLGMPIPFNNLGSPIEEIFIGHNGQDYENLARVHRLAAAQIHRYQGEYARIRNVDPGTASITSAMWTKADGLWQALAESESPGPEQWKAAYEALVSYEKENLRMCRALWARFDLTRMALGVAILLGALVVLSIYARGIEGDSMMLIPVLVSRGVSCSLAGAVAAALCAYFFLTPVTYFSAVGAGFGGLLGITSAFVTVREFLISPLPDSGWGFYCLMVTAALSVGFASNSYTIWEDEILLFFIGSFGVAFLVSSLRLQDANDSSLGCFYSISFVVLSRAASLSRLCREEQMPHCRSTYYASTTSSTSAPWQLVILFVVAFVLPDVIRAFYARTHSYLGSAVWWIGIAFRLGLLLIAVFWFLDVADDAEWFHDDKGTLKTVRIYIALFVLALAFAIGTAVFAWSAPFVSVAPSNTQDEARDSRAGAAQLPSAKADRPSTIAGNPPITVLGSDNVHGSRYFLLVIIWLLATILVSKPMGGFVLSTLGTQILLLYELLHLTRLSHTAVGPTVLALLGSFHFFKTGHQATLSSIQWESAFIPLRSVAYPWSPLLVLLNTFGAQILCAVAVPGLAVWRKAPRQRGLLDDVAQAVSTHVLFYAGVNVATTVWAGHLRRHLMLYRVFMPRFLMGAVVLLVVELVVVFVGVAAVRTNALSVAQVFGW